MEFSLGHVVIINIFGSTGKNVMVMGKIFCGNLVNVKYTNLEKNAIKYLVCLNTKHSTFKVIWSATTLISNLTQKHNVFIRVIETKI